MLTDTGRNNKNEDIVGLVIAVAVAIVDTSNVSSNDEHVVRCFVIIIIVLIFQLYTSLAIALSQAIQSLLPPWDALDVDRRSRELQELAN